MTFPATPCPVCSGPRVVVAIHAMGCQDPRHAPCAGWDAVCERCARVALEAGAAKDGRATKSDQAMANVQRSVEARGAYLAGRGRKTSQQECET